MTVPVYQNNNSATSGTGVTTTGAISMPVSTAAGDGIVILLAYQGTASVSATPSGYTLLNTSSSGTTSSDVKIGIYYKRAVASEPAVTFNFTASTQFNIIINRITGIVSTGTFIDNFAANSGNVVTNTFSGFTTNSVDTLIMALEGLSSSTANQWVDPSGYTFAGSTGAGLIGTGISVKNFVGSGSVASTTGTWTSQSAGDKWATVHLAVASSAVLNSYSLPATKQTYTASAIAATPAKGRPISATKQTYSANAFAATLVRGRAVTATKQAFAATSVAAGALYGRYLPAAVRSYTVTVQDAPFTKTRTLTADPQAYSTTFGQASLFRGKMIVASVRSYTFNGIAVQLRKGGTLAADTKALSATSISAQLSTTAKAGSGRSRAATMALFQQLHDKTQKELREQLALNDELIVLGDTPKKKKIKKRKKDDLEELNAEIADLDNELASLQNIIDIPPLPVDRLDAIAFPQQVGYTDQNIDDDADDEEVIAHYLLNHPF